MNYWTISLWNKEEIQVRPDNVDYIKQKLKEGEGHIVTKTRTIAVKDIRVFEESDKPVIKVANLVESGLKEQAAQAFNEPMLSETGAVLCRAVKKRVTRRKFDTHYSQIGYTSLDEDDSHVWAAWWQPIHQIDETHMTVCSEAESKKVK